MATKVSKAEQERIKKAQAQAMEDSARQFLDEKTILNMQAAGRQRQQEEARRDELLRQQAIAQQGLSAEDRLRQAFDQEKTKYETEAQNRLNSLQAGFDQKYAALQQEQQRQQSNYGRQIRDLQTQLQNRQAGYDSTIRVLQNQLKGQTAANQAAQNTTPQNTAVANAVASRAAQNTSQPQQKTQGDVDFTKAPQAQTAEDVNNQDAKTRTWQSLNYAYNSKIDESNRSYNKAISQLNNTMLSRGMPRSSYAAQLNANMYNDMIKAQNDIRKSQIADYQNRIGDIEAQEKEDEWRNKEWEYRLSRDEVADKRYEDETAYGRGRDTVADKRYEDETAYARSRDTVADKRYEDETAYARSRDAVADERYSNETAYSREQDALNRAFAEKQWEAQQDQWKQQFDYEKMSDEQKLNYETVMYALQNGKDVSDEMLAKAGISRDDFNAMKQQVSASGAASTSGSSDNNTNTSTTDAGLQEGLSSSNSTTGGMPLNPNLPTIVKNIESEQAKTNPTKLNAAKASVGEATTTTKSTSDLDKILKNTKVPTKSKLLTNSVKKK